MLMLGDKIPSEKIDFRTQALHCKKIADLDRAHSEYGTVSYFDPGSQKISMPDQFIQGGEDKLSLLYEFNKKSEYTESVFEKLPSDLKEQYTSELDIISRNLVNSEEAARLFFEQSAFGDLTRRFIQQPVHRVHSHPSPVTFSHFDIVSFLTIPTVRMDTLITSDRKLHALVASKETTFLNPKQADYLLLQWASIQEGGVFLQNFNPTNYLKNPKRWLSTKSEKVRRAHIKEIAPTYKIGFYEGNIEDGILNRFA
jgi:hypothetical protein